MYREFIEEGRKVAITEDRDCIQMSIYLKPNEDITEEQAEQEVVNLMCNPRIKNEFNFLFDNANEFLLDKRLFGYGNNELITWQVADWR